MSEARSGLRLLRRLLVAAGFLLPAMTLVPFGWIWLWQQGYALWWVAALLVSTMLAFWGQWWLTRHLSATASTAPAASPFAPPETPREGAAREAVEQLAEATDPDTLQSRDAMLALGVTTIETVAAHMHPGEEEPVWKFTLPEALALVETTAARLRPMIVDNVPFGDRITVGQALRLYRWRGAVDVAEKAYDLWRIVRLANPLTALTQEARERMTKKLYEGVKDEVTRRMVRAYVVEVGRAAIDLYSGRLRIHGSLPPGVAPSSGPPLAPAATTPLRILVAGQTSAGKSSLVNALIERTAAKVDVLPATTGFSAYALQRQGMPEAVLVDSAGVGPAAPALAKLADAALESDVVIWVAAANRADRDVDRRALDALRAKYAARLDRRAPPILLALTHIDRLRPFQEWQPPYDVAEPATEKARSIRAAMDAAAADLFIPIADIVPVSLAPGVAPANVDLVWARMTGSLPDAEGARLSRLIDDLGKGNWRTVMTQAMNAGRLVGGAVWQAVRERRG